MPKAQIISIHDPIEIEIFNPLSNEKKTFTAIALTGEIIRKNLKMFDDLLRGGNMYAPHDRVCFLLNVQSEEDKAFIDKLDVRTIQQITETLIRLTYGFQALSAKSDANVSPEQAEKNAQGAGESK